jgi:hypothetical protein
MKREHADHNVYGVRSFLWHFESLGQFNDWARATNPVVARRVFSSSFPD